MKSYAGKRFPSIFLCLTLSCCGCWKSRKDSQEIGKSLYDRHCANCHDARGLALRVEPPSLEHVFTHKLLPDGQTPADDRAVASIIIHGRRTMPPFEGRVSEKQAEDIVAYLHTR